jgi:hypothetical protein
MKNNSNTIEVSKNGIIGLVLFFIFFACLFYHYQTESNQKLYQEAYNEGHYDGYWSRKNEQGVF